MNPPPRPSITIPITMVNHGLEGADWSTSATAVVVGRSVIGGRGVPADNTMVGRTGVAVSASTTGGGDEVGTCTCALGAAPVTGNPLTGALVVAKPAEIHPRPLALVGRTICSQSLAVDRPTTCAVSPFLSCPATAALVEGPDRIRRFSLAVAVTPADTGGLGG